ncbi:MAG: beta chain-like quinoprotein amine dehydrogenase [Paenibacillus sp.]|nr:beta chain-like quinoprotein amine dehydrogenase [Paenibacillus sp.]
MSLLTNRRPEAIAQPSRNFCILGKTRIRDPLDGREKLVLANFAAHATGNIILIDTETGAGESILFPGDAGAWALYNWNDEKLIVGTCAKYGYVHSLDLRTRAWAQPLRDENETYIWNFTKGADGYLYGGTYPGCVLLRYDPDNHVLENVGRMSDNLKNMYSRYVGSVPGHIIIVAGLDDSFAAAWNIETGEVKRFASFPGFPHLEEVNDSYISMKFGDEKIYYDSVTFNPIDPATIVEQPTSFSIQLTETLQGSGIPLDNGQYGGVRGQDYFIASQLEDTPLLKRIPTEAPATHIYGLTADEEGRIWGSSGFGQTIFSYDPTDGSYWNSSTVCNSGGEVYGMRFVDGLLFLTAYSGGDHIVYDPSKPWDQVGNVNPRTLESVFSKWIRPLGHSIVGPDRAIWTGWSAKYGVYGGGITRLDTKTLELSSWSNPLAEQQVSSLAADESYVYFVSSLGGNGLQAQDEPCHFGVLATDGSLVHGEELPAGTKPGKVCAAGGRIWLVLDESLRIFSADKMSFTDTIEIGKKAHGLCAANERELLLFTDDQLLVMDVSTGEYEVRASIPGIVDKAVITPDRTLYFGIGIQLYSLKLSELGVE